MVRRFVASEKVRIASVVCAYVYGLVGVFNDPGPGWNALRSVPI
jgi:hypothetical protein